MAPWGQQSEHCLATTSQDDYEANWNIWTDDGQDHVLSQADALTKKVVCKSKSQKKVGKQAGAELCQAQGKLKLVNYILVQFD